MMCGFKVQTDEELFNRFNELSQKVRHLGGMFQNVDTVVSEKDVNEWFEIFEDVRKEMSVLQFESSKKLEKTGGQLSWNF